MKKEIYKATIYYNDPLAFPWGQGDKYFTHFSDNWKEINKIFDDKIKDIEKTPKAFIKASYIEPIKE